MNEYEKNLVIKRANKDAKKAINDWKKYGTIGIDEIIKGMGYDQKSLYSFTKRIWEGMNSYIINLDTYGLIIRANKNIDIEIMEA